MKILIIAIGTKLPDWINKGINEYKKRFNTMVNFNLEIKEISAQKRRKNANIKKISAIESKQLIKAVPNNFIPIALDVTGQSFSSETLAKKLQLFCNNSENIAILIGGPEGFNDDIRQFVHQRWSLSNLTLPHPIVRIILIETLYRSISILYNKPYHRNE